MTRTAGSVLCCTGKCLNRGNLHVTAPAGRITGNAHFTEGFDPVFDCGTLGLGQIRRAGDQRNEQTKKSKKAHGLTPVLA
jgi:hypothetical protein